MAALCAGAVVWFGCDWLRFRRISVALGRAGETLRRLRVENRRLWFFLSVAVARSAYRTAVGMLK